MTHPTISRLLDRGLYDLLHHVCGMRGVTPEEVCGRSHTKAPSGARHELWALLYHHPTANLSYSQIARLCGVTHRTVMAGVAKFHPASLTYPAPTSSALHDELNRPWMADGLGWQT